MFRYGSPSHSRAGRGFPIRTSWDQSSVINSPRLIADSHVLLRLLMPRHPPCALKNLTITHTTNTNPHTHHTPKGTTRDRDQQPTPKGRPTVMRDTQNLRCSRPLCSSQTTTPVNTPPTPHTGAQAGMPRKTRNPNNHTPPTPGNQPRKTRSAPDPGRVQPLLPQDPTVCHTPPNQQPTSPFHNPHPQPPQRKESGHRSVLKPAGTNPAPIR